MRILVRLFLMVMLGIIVTLSSVLMACNISSNVEELDKYKVSISFWLYDDCYREYGHRAWYHTVDAVGEHDAEQRAVSALIDEYKDSKCLRVEDVKVTGIVKGPKELLLELHSEPITSGNATTLKLLFTPTSLKAVSLFWSIYDVANQTSKLDGGPVQEKYIHDKFLSDYYIGTEGKAPCFGPGNVWSWKRIRPKTLDPQIITITFYPIGTYPFVLQDCMDIIEMGYTDRIGRGRDVNIRLKGSYDAFPSVGAMVSTSGFDYPFEYAYFSSIITDITEEVMQ